MNAECGTDPLGGDSGGGWGMIGHANPPLFPLLSIVHTVRHQGMHYHRPMGKHF